MHGVALRYVKRHGGADERLQGLFIDPVALVEVDGAPRVALKRPEGSSSEAPLAKGIFTTAL
jgi:hypothetical protein